MTLGTPNQPLESHRVDYGLDAPPVVRNLLLAAVAGLGLWGSAALRIWTGAVHLRLGAIVVLVDVAPAGLSIGAACLAVAVWMIWSSKVGKVRARERLLDTRHWLGNERVLDVGCGRGVLLLGAAKRLRPGSGRAVGIDLWRSEDLAGNAPAAVWANAAAEGVTDRIAIETADMRHLPFAAGSFDVVLSQAAVHNLATAGARREALEEIARVLRPGGELILADIRHLHEYAGVLRAQGLTVAIEGSALARILLTILTFGALRPGVLRGRQPLIDASDGAAVSRLMRTIGGEQALSSLVERLRRIRPDSSRCWGTLTAGEMLCHLGDAHESVLGTRIPPGSPPSGIARPFLKWIALYAPVPWPKGAKTRPGANPRIDGTRPGDFEQDRDRAIASLKALALAAPATLATCHFMFGPMSARDWHRWAYRHVTYHLRQFGL